MSRKGGGRGKKKCHQMSHRGGGGGLKSAEKVSRIMWMAPKNRPNLWKFRSRIESTIQIFKNRTHESGFANLWSQIRQSQNETNLLGVRIHDHIQQTSPNLTSPNLT